MLPQRTPVILVPPLSRIEATTVTFRTRIPALFLHRRRHLVSNLSRIGILVILIASRLSLTSPWLCRASIQNTSTNPPPISESSSLIVHWRPQTLAGNLKKRIGGSCPRPIVPTPFLPTRLRTSFSLIVANETTKRWKGTLQPIYLREDELRLLHFFPLSLSVSFVDLSLVSAGALTEWLGNRERVNKMGNVRIVIQLIWGFDISICYT